MKRVQPDLVGFPIGRLTKSADYELQRLVDYRKRSLSKIKPSFYFPFSYDKVYRLKTSALAEYYDYIIKADIGLYFHAPEYIHIIIDNQSCTGGFYELVQGSTLRYVTPVFPGLCSYELSLKNLAEQSSKFFFFYYTDSGINIGRLALSELQQTPFSDIFDEMAVKYYQGFRETHLVTPLQRFELVMYRHANSQMSIMQLLEDYINANDFKIKYQFSSVFRCSPEAGKPVVYKTFSCILEMQENLQVSPQWKRDRANLAHLCAELGGSSYVPLIGIGKQEDAAYTFLISEFGGLDCVYHVMEQLPKYPVRSASYFYYDARFCLLQFESNIFYITVDRGSTVYLIDGDDCGQCLIVNNEISADLLAFNEHSLLLRPLHCADYVETVQLLIPTKNLAAGTFCLSISQGKYRECLVIKDGQFYSFKLLDKINFIYMKTALLLPHPDYYNYENYIEWLLSLLHQFKAYKITRKQLGDQAQKIQKEIWVLFHKFKECRHFYRNMIYEVFVIIQLLKVIFSLPYSHSSELWNIALFLSNLMLNFIVSYDYFAEEMEEPVEWTYIDDSSQLVQRLLAKPQGYLSNFELAILAYSDFSPDEASAFGSAVAQAFANNIGFYNALQKRDYTYIQVVFLVIYKAIARAIYYRWQINFKQLQISFDELLASFAKLRARYRYCKNQTYYFVRIMGQALIESLLLQHSPGRQQLVLLEEADFGYFSDLYCRILIVAYYQSFSNCKTILQNISKVISTLFSCLKRNEYLLFSTFGFSQLLLTSCQVGRRMCNEAGQLEQVYSALLEDALSFALFCIEKEQIYQNSVLLLYFAFLIALVLNEHKSNTKILSRFYESENAFNSVLLALKAENLMGTLSRYCIRPSVCCVQRIITEMQLLLVNSSLAALSHYVRISCGIANYLFDVSQITTESYIAMTQWKATLVINCRTKTAARFARTLFCLGVYVLATVPALHGEVKRAVSTNNLWNAFDHVMVDVQEEHLLRKMFAFVYKCKWSDIRREKQIAHGLEMSYYHARGQTNPDYLALFHTTQVRYGNYRQIRELVALYCECYHSAEACFVIVYFLKQTQSWKDRALFLTDLFPHVDEQVISTSISAEERDYYVKLLVAYLQRAKCSDGLLLVPKCYLSARAAKECAFMRFEQNYYLVKLKDQHFVYSFDQAFDIMQMKQFLQAHYSSCRVYLSTVRKLLPKHLDSPIMQEVREALLEHVLLKVPFSVVYYRESTAEMPGNGAYLFYHIKDRVVEVTATTDPLPNLDYRVRSQTISIALSDLQLYCFEINTKLADMEQMMAHLSAFEVDRVYCKLQGICMPQVNAGMARALEQLLSREKDKAQIAHLARKIIDLLELSSKVLYRIEGRRPGGMDYLHKALVSEIERQIICARQVIVMLNE